MNKSIKNLLRKTGSDVITLKKIRCFQPTSNVPEISQVQVPILSFGGKLLHSTAQEFYSIPKSPPLYQSPDYLPQDRSEIRGLDAIIHRWATSKFDLARYPAILRSKFVYIQFFPTDHIVSNFRKSNIAFAMNLFRISEFNNSDIFRFVSDYNGQYCNLQTIKEKHMPIETACGRTKVKKKFRRLFIDALKSNNDIKNKSRLSGTYLCHVLRIPITEEECKIVINDYLKMIDRLTNIENQEQDLDTMARIKRSNHIRQTRAFVKIFSKVNLNWDVKFYKSPKKRFPFLDTEYVNEYMAKPINKNNQQQQQKKPQQLKLQQPGRVEPSMKYNNRNGRQQQQQLGNIRPSMKNNNRISQQQQQQQPRNVHSSMKNNKQENQVNTNGKKRMNTQR